MRLRGVLSALCLVLGAGTAWADGPTYTLAAPMQPGFVQFARAGSSVVVSNAWMNGAFAASGGVATNVAVSVRSTSETAQKRYSLASSELGFTMERNQPEYYLSDVIGIPGGDAGAIDWNATKAAYDKLYEELAAKGQSPGFLLNPDKNNHCVYAIAGGAQSFTWYFTDGTSNTVNYTIGSTCSGRPRRIYWTDAPYNAPPVLMSGKHVRIFDNNGVTKMAKGTVTNIVGGVETVQENAIVRGVYIDPSAETLYAVGQPEGQFVLAYYDTGDYNNILCVEVIEALRPEAIAVTGTIGQKLSPTGMGYDIEGLEAQVTAGVGDSTDNRGDYLYQHKGQQAYSPKNGDVYPLRPTYGQRWKAEIYWMETDPMGVQWPFELDQYENDWPASGNLYVRGSSADDTGAKIYFPDDYTATLCDYQEPNGHALAVEGDSSFATTGEGWSLVKLEGDDDIWFLPIHSVLNTDTNFFTRTVFPIPVGDEFLVRGGVASGTTVETDATVGVTDEAAGYIYPPTSGTQYNPHLYAATTNASADADSSEVPSAIFAVNTAEKDIEVWWSRRVTELDGDALPSWIDIPALPQVYRPVWPDTTEAPTLVIASQQGGAGESLHMRHGAATFELPNARLNLVGRTYFPNGTGTLLFWTRPCASAEAPESVTNAPSCLVQMGSGKGEALVLRIGRDEKLELLVNEKLLASVAIPDYPRVNIWTHIALALEGAERYRLYVDDKLAAEGALTNAGFLAQTLSACYAGFGADPTFTNRLEGVVLGAAPARQLAEIQMRDTALDETGIAQAVIRTLSGSEAGLTGYYSFRRGEDLVAAKQASGNYDDRTFLDRTMGFSCASRNVSIATPGAPVYDSCVIASDSTPSVYYENDPDAVGYNPNDEHALITSGAGGYIAWALRADLNRDGRPAVLVEYEKDGRAKMQFFHVAVTNALYPALSADCTAGAILPGPQPITLMDTPWLAEDWFETDRPGMPAAAYRDRKGQIWARCAGEIPIYMYYRMQEGFYFPQYGADEQPEAGTSIPWLSVYANPALADDPLGLKSVGAVAKPAVWRWKVNWPETANTMKIGQTLYTASGGLPGVYNMKSVALLYPSATEESDDDRTVVLTDPTVVQSVDFDYALLATLGLTTDKNGGLTLRKGKYTFNELPPHLSSRVYVDTTNGKLCLSGKWDEKAAGTSVLYVNVLNSVERDQLLKVVPESMRTGDAWQTWMSAVESLGVARVEPNRMAPKGNVELTTTYLPRDSYALSAMGNTNWVVLIENDAPTTNYTATVDGVATTVNMGVSAGDAINMHLFQVVPEYYAGEVVSREDEQNLLSQRLTVLYTDSFAGESDRYEFEWRSKSPTADGDVPLPYEDYDLRAGFADAKMPRITIGEQGDTLANMVNKYWVCRYRAKDSTCPAWKVMGDKWSDWCGPALAEGWVQRVLNNVTPFNQLMTDLYENEAETAISMIAKAGKPYQGDVAFNQEALTDSGLIELYETLLNKAESLSLMLGVRDTDVNKQLMQAVERLDDLYALLGDEAYTDAKNPTIGFGSNVANFENQPQVDFGNASSALFCFDNQVRTLLDEELALLRGRAADSLPYATKNPGETNEYRVTNKAPYYNRLLWNFTKGITAGEVAYAVNYNIEGEETVALSEEQAAVLYPQGHGDAYGHYLSALKGWYRLLRNPYFDWARVQIEMTVADSSVNVDYFDEEKFAAAALKVAKTSADVVDLTARKAYDDTGAKLAGYRDSDANRAFGYGEWANRGAYGALCNWAVANSMMPEDASKVEGEGEEVSAYYDPTGLKRIDRGTVDELGEICSQAAAIQRAEDRIDGGLNPLGLSADAIPFDITPIGVDDGSLTHYEQIRERAGTAVANARALLDAAQDQSNRLRLLQEANDEYEDMINETELAYKQELIGYYGRPYSDDCGPGKTYEQGYDGPDLYHYMWMDLADFNLTDPYTTAVSLSYYNGKQYYAATDYTDLIRNYEKAENRTPLTLSYDKSAYGIVVKPSNISGSRPMQGSIQEKYAAFLRAARDVEGSLWDVECRSISVERARTHCDAVIGMQSVLSIINETSYACEATKAVLDYNAKKTILSFEVMAEGITDNADVATSSTPKVTGAGMTVVTDPSSVVSAVLDGAANASKQGVKKLSNSVQNMMNKVDMIAAECYQVLNAYKETIAAYDKQYECVEEMVEALEAYDTAVWQVQQDMLALNEALEAYKSEVAKAELVLDKREAERRKWVNKLSQQRYNDMFIRIVRNQALARYTAAFDIAQQYVWEAAKAYGYETGMPSGDNASAESFMDEIIQSRSLGSFDADGKPIVGDVGDTGLAGILARMDANWLVLKPRLGINNPQSYATWFSLRSECFRILPDEEGDAAWAKELTKYWVDDIRSNADFRHYCQPFYSQFGLKDKEPGLIIPFETTIDFAKNLFGQDLAGEDNAYDSTWYATRIYAAGVWFDGYNARANGYTKKAQLANTPVAYLVPMGYDCMRVPGLDDGAVAAYKVVDQVIAAPYAIGSQYLNDLSWYPSASEGDLGGADATTKIRRHPSFRAYFDVSGGEPMDAQLDCTRLIGRSVWNTKWMLVIPAGSMNADRDKALSIFINGSDENRDGKIDLKPVSDIKIGFKTYSNSGN